MKKILLSLGIIAAVAAVIVGGTMAVFSDQKKIEGNTVSTGTLELTLNKSAGKPFSVSGMAPGDVTGWEYMDIFNGPFPAVPGQLPFEAEMTVNKTAGDAVLWNALEIEMKTSGWDSDCTNGDGGEGLIYNGLINAFPAGMTVSDIAYWHNANEDDGTGPPDNIRAGWSERVCQRVKLPSTAGNEVQGKSVTFEEVVDAVQDDD